MEFVAKIVVKIVANIAVLSLHHLAHIVCHSSIIFKKGSLGQLCPHNQRLQYKRNTLAQLDRDVFLLTFSVWLI